MIIVREFKREDKNKLLDMIGEINNFDGNLGCLTNDEDLIELGIEQAKELKEKIKNINFDIIICSPLNRVSILQK